MQIALAFIDSVVIEEVSLPLWRELFDAIGWPPSISGRGGTLTHDDILDALQRDMPGDELLQALETLHDLGTPAGRETISALVTDRQIPFGALPQDLGEHELALRLFLAQRTDGALAEVFSRAQVQIQEGDHRRFNDFLGKKPSAIHDLKAKRPTLEFAIREHCRKADLGDHVQVRVFDDGDGTCRFQIMRSHHTRTPLAARGESRSYEGSTQSIRRTTLTRMAMGTRETDQPPLWIATSDLPTSPGHPFYARLTTLLDGHHFDRFVEGLCDRFYAPVMGRPSLAPGRYFRLLLVGYFEGIDSERGIAWRATDSLAVRSFLRLAVDEAPPDHSTIARTRRLIDLETHRTVFTWVQQRLVEAGRLTGKTIAIDATTLEANAAMRSIVRRDTGESDQAFLAGLATASGVETPTREGLARLDRKRKKKTSNTDWTNPHDPDAKVTKMKDGRTHLAHKAEHAVDMETGAIVAVTLQGADVGDTTTIIETAIAAAEQVEDAQANVDDRQSLEEIVGDKGYHSNQTLIDLDAVGIRSYVSEPDRGRRDWSKDPEARAPVYGNRRRMRGRRGRRLMRQRGERIERSFAHLYDTGGMRRTHLRGHTNILKRLLIHAGGFNLGLVMRHLIGIGTPRGLQGRVAAVLATLGVLMGVVRRRLTTISSSHRLIPAVRGRLASLATFAVNSSAAITCTTGC